MKTIIERKPLYEVGDVCSTENGHLEVILEVITDPKRMTGYKTMALTDQRLNSEHTFKKGSTAVQNFETFETWRYKKNFRTF